MVELVQQHPSGGYILDELHVGMAAEKIVVATEDRIRLFAEASDDFNPVHLDEAFASKTAYRGRIAHGLLSASFGSAVVGTILPGVTWYCHTCSRKVRYAASGLSGSRRSPLVLRFKCSCWLNS